MDDFRKFATKHLGMNSMVLDDVIKSQGYLNPYILEERQLNVTQLDVFSRLMMDRIIFLMLPKADYVGSVSGASVDKSGVFATPFIKAFSPDVPDASNGRVGVFNQQPADRYRWTSDRQ